MQVETPIVEWKAPPTYLKSRFTAQALLLLVGELVFGFVGATVLYFSLHSILPAVIFFVVSVGTGFMALVFISRASATTVRARADVLEVETGSKTQKTAYGNIGSCLVVHQEHQGARFALLNLEFTASYQSTRRWNEPKVLKPIAIGETELPAIVKLFQDHGIEVIDRGTAPF